MSLDPSDITVFITGDGYAAAYHGSTLIAEEDTDIVLEDVLIRLGVNVRYDLTIRGRAPRTLEDAEAAVQS